MKGGSQQERPDLGLCATRMGKPMLTVSLPFPRDEGDPLLRDKENFVATKDTDLFEWRVKRERGRIGRTGKQQGRQKFDRADKDGLTK